MWKANFRCSVSWALILGKECVSQKMPSVLNREGSVNKITILCPIPYMLQQGLCLEKITNAQISCHIPWILWNPHRKSTEFFPMYHPIRNNDRPPLNFCNLAPDALVWPVICQQRGKPRTLWKTLYVIFFWLHFLGWGLDCRLRRTFSRTTNPRPL